MFSLMLLIFSLAFIFEICDSAFGQGYGTLGSPTFLLLDFDPKIVVPSILISQAAGGLTGAYLHNKYKNADFTNHKTADIKKVYFIALCGIFGVLAASFIGFKISKALMTTYIGTVALAMGIIILSGITLKFTWKKLSIIGAISAFNKGLSGGGYGPIVAGGQTIIGVEGKPAVGITDLAEAPICISGFIMWSLLEGGIPPLSLMLPMCLGSTLAPFIGTWLTYKIPANKFKSILGLIIVVLGILCLAKVLNP